MHQHLVIHRLLLISRGLQPLFHIPQRQTEMTDVYESDRIGTPFLLGIFDPRIYLPVGLPQEQRAYVLAHELVHLKRRDYLVKTLAWLAVSLHWFNPLVWLAYGLMAPVSAVRATADKISDCR